MLVEPPPFSQQSAATPFRAVRDAKPKASAASKSIFDKSSVMAAPGLILVDGDQEWVVEAIDDAGAMTRFGGSSRRFAFGASVVSRGRQRGPLRPAIGANGVTVEDASVRAYDILRQTREQLRAGKPAYVVYDDATLERLALAMPTSVRDLLAIQGIGPGKLEQYGDAILLAIEDAREAPVAEN